MGGQPFTFTLSLMIRAFAAVVGLLVATVVASQLAMFLEIDSCLDAGGIYVRATGACSVSSGVEYVAQFARPDLYVLWSIFLVLTGLPFWLAYKAVTALAARLAGQTARKLNRIER